MKTVLIVDDDPAICELIRDILAEARIDTLCAKSDIQAYRIMAKPPAIGALVVDINLGVGTTGFDVARFGRQVVPNLPVIYVSGQATPTMFAQSAVPNSDFLLKPFAADELLRIVAQRLADRRPPRLECRGER